MVYEVADCEPELAIIDDSTSIEFQTGTDEFASELEVGFEDVGGLDAELQQLRELIELPLRQPAVYRHLGIQPPRGILLYGPPGSGKTHLARAVANEFDARVFLVNGPAVVGTMRGETESNLRAVFDEAAHHAPSIIVIDEIDGIAPHRRDAGTLTDVRTVTTLLSAMDGLSDIDGVVVIGTTNRVDQIDPALRRPGRFDREIAFTPPGKEARERILRIHTRDMPLEQSLEEELGKVAEVTGGFVGADIVELCREAALHALRRSIEPSADAPLTTEQVLAAAVTIEYQDFVDALNRVRPSASREWFVKDVNTRGSEVFGLADELAFLVQLCDADADINEVGGLSHLNGTGVLLTGPSGCGKSTLVGAVARVAKRNLCVIDGPEIFGRWLGESEEAIRHVFSVAKRLAPSILFLDQLDAIAPPRGTDMGTKTTERVVNQLIAELDALSDGREVALFAATNRPDLVDSAVLQGSRFGIRVQLNLPDLHARSIALQSALGIGATADDGSTNLARALAEETEGLSIADIQLLVWQVRLRKGLKGVKGDTGGAPVSIADFREARASMTISVQ